MDWYKLQAFYHVAQKGSFTHAAQALNVNQSSLSRHVIDLETTLNIQLLNRSRLGVSLTPKGSELYRFVSKTLDAEKKIKHRLQAFDKNEDNILRISVARSYGLPFLTMLLKTFLHHHPEIHVVLHDYPTQGPYDNYDAYVGPGFVRLRGYIKQILHTFTMRFYASESYLRSHGTPKTLKDLQHHRVLFCQGGAEHHLDWLARLNERHHLALNPHLVLNSSLLLLRAVEANLGVATLRDDFLKGHQNKNVIEILENFKSHAKEVYLIYPETKVHKPSVVLLRKFLDTYLKNMR